MSRRSRNAAQRRLARVRAAFDPAELKRICEMPQSEFTEYARRFELEPQHTWRGELQDNFYYFLDNNASSLAVAHLDHVQKDPTCHVLDTKDGPLALAGALDDRLGAYIILEMLPKLGIPVDILLTTNEEMGESTAQDFILEYKQYNWMIEFDRGGTDVVMYDYETPELCDLVKACGAKVGVGSFSDIAYLEHLGCAGFNWGVGYYDYHSKRSHAWLNDYFSMLAKFIKFYMDNADTFLEHTPKRRSSGFSYLLVDDCPRCEEGELDRWSMCSKCGYGWYESDGWAAGWVASLEGVDERLAIEAAATEGDIDDYDDRPSRMDEQQAAQA